MHFPWATLRIAPAPTTRSLEIRVHISAKAGGAVIFEAEAMSKIGFETNRCGFCILHPIVGVAGTPGLGGTC